MSKKYEAALSFLNLEISEEEYGKIAGENIRLMVLDNPVTVSANNVIIAVQKLLDCEITIEELVNWVNIVWFSDAYDFEEEQTNCIISVIDQLECLDEEGVSFTVEQYQQMISALRENTEFPCLYT